MVIDTREHLPGGTLRGIRNATAARPARCFYIAAILLGLGTADGVLAEDFGVPVTQPVPLNSNASKDTGSDIVPHLATDGNGTWIAVWQSNDDPNGTISDNDILFSRSTDGGQFWSAPAALNTNAATDSVNSTDRDPYIATDGNGLWLCVWVSNDPLGGTVGDELDIFISRSTNDGASWTPPASLNDNADTDNGADFDPVVATDGNGLWVAVWRSLDTLDGTLENDADLLVARSTDGGQSWTFPVPLNTNAADNTAIGQDIRPQLVSLGHARWIAVWESNDTLNDQVGNDYDILFATSDDDAQSWSAPQPVNTNASTDSGDDVEATMVLGSGGTLLVAWSSEENLNNSLGTDWDILFAVSDDGGASWSAPLPLNANAAGDAGDDKEPHLAADSQGDWVAVWSSSESLGSARTSETDIFIARSDDPAASWTTPCYLSSNAEGGSGNDDSPILVTDGEGAWRAVWSSTDSLNQTIGTDPDLLSAAFALPDCNFNTIPDSTEPDSDNNGIPDDCESLCPPGDINDDGAVNVGDLLIVIQQWGACANPCPPACPADIAPSGGDCQVSVQDLLGVIGAWGPCP